MSLQTSIKTAQLEWSEDSQPVSTLFNDVYFSRVSGLEETRYVFINHNQLQSRFNKLKMGECFTIGETGFGSGLNFLAAWSLFDKKASFEARLHFVSVEKFPFSFEDLQKALALWPSLHIYCDELLSAYPKTPLPGYHRFSFAGGRVMLTLIFDDALKALSEFSGAVDAWFLDGFAPARNPDMWSSPLFYAMAALSHSQTSYATFTVASVVREELKQAGFSVERVKGFGRKCHMLCGRYMGSIECSDTTPIRKKKVWLSRTKKVFTQRKAIVVGAGLAGCSTAYALAQRGWCVHVVDQAEFPAAGASGNLQGALYMRLSGGDTPLSKLLIQGYAHSRSLLETSLNVDRCVSWDLPGLIQTGFDDKERLRQQKIIARALPEAFIKHMSSSELSKVSGIHMNQDGLCFEQGGWVHPPALCEAMLNAPEIIFHGGHVISELMRTETDWVVKDVNGWSLSAPVVVVANSYAAANLVQTAYLPLKTIRGQLSYLPVTEKSKALKTVLCGENYIAPAFRGVHTLGATHQFNDMDCREREEDHLLNLKHLQEGFPSMYDALEGDHLVISELKGRAGFRCTTPDYLPVIGPVVNEVVFNREFARLADDAKTPFISPPTYLSGLYVNVGHGSRGLITCPLSGELIAGYIENEGLPVSSEVMEALHPNRFLARALIRSKGTANLFPLNNR